MQKLHNDKVLQILPKSPSICRQVRVATGGVNKLGMFLQQNQGVENCMVSKAKVWRKYLQAKTCKFCGEVKELLRQAQYCSRRCSGRAYRATRHAELNAKRRNWYAKHSDPNGSRRVLATSRHEATVNKVLDEVHGL